MKNIVYVNELIEWYVEGEIHSTERVLWIDQDYTIAIVIDIFAESGLPTSRTKTDIVDSLSDGLVKKASHDPFSHKNLVAEDNLSESERATRDKAWAVISPLVTSENEPAIYRRDLRGSMIRELVSNFNADKPKGVDMKKILEE